uniref:Inner centromere protein ARK-binding domain-containing protein n=1 Tax=Globodera rostochiensis TaxID=31243 RepID=A0A914HA72_GLORO
MNYANALRINHKEIKRRAVERRIENLDTVFNLVDWSHYDPIMQQIFRDKFENVLKKKAEDLKRMRTKIELAFIVEAETEHISGDPPIDESIANEQQHRQDDTFVGEAATEHESFANEQRQDDTFVVAGTEHISGDPPIDESIANEQQQRQDDTFVGEAATEHISGDPPIDESIANEQQQRQDDTFVGETATEHVSVDLLIDEAIPPIGKEIARKQNATYILEAATTCFHNLTKKRSPISTETDYGIDDFTSGDDTDPEDEPRKQIPHWADGKSLERHIIKIRGILSTMNIERYFGRIKEPDAQDLFKSFNKLYPKRRPSTANWNSPMSNPTPGVVKRFSMSK